MAPRFAGGAWLMRGDRTPQFPPEDGVGLIEFTADWCLPCRESYPTLRALTRPYRSGLTNVLVTSLDSTFGGQAVKPAEWMATAREYFGDEAQIPFVYVARDQSTSRAYHAQGIPQFVLVDRSGRVRQILVGWSPAIAARLETLVHELSHAP
jgi:thiol-disulfide isomerase/thioredoxin